MELTFPKKNCEHNYKCKYGHYQHRQQIYTDSTHDGEVGSTSGARGRGAPRDKYQMRADQKQNSQSAKHSHDHQYVLDPREEQALADEGLSAEASEWPEY